MKKFVAILLGLLAAVLILEGSMRGIGWGYLYLQEKRNQLYAGDENSIQIVCIGESTTAIGGPNSWPNQLELLLNNIQNVRTFNVINRGMPGTNTSEILKRLPTYLNKYKPDYVLAMVGVNDDIAYIGVTKGNIPTGQLSPTNILEHMRTYGLIRWITRSIRLRFQGMNGEKIPATSPEIGEQAPSNSEYQLRSKYSLLTRANLNEMARITLKQGSNFVFVQYPHTKVDLLQSFIVSDASYISSYDVFRNALKKYKYDELFTDDFGIGFGHATKLGNRILAENVARNLLGLMESKN